MGNGQSLVAKVQARNASAMVAAQAPTPQNTPAKPDALKTLSNMSDSELAALYTASKTVDMPNQLKDVSDETQRFIFAAGLNEKPIVLDQNEFAKFMSDNNLRTSDLISRSVNGITYTNSSGTTVKMTADDVTDMMMYSRLNYIGGKHGGQALGAGTYFDHTNGRSTGYGAKTVTAVLNPKTARVISYSALGNAARQFDATHPAFARATGGYNGWSNTSVYATAMGYNVIQGSGGYINVIDRRALVWRKD